MGEGGHAHVENNHDDDDDDDDVRLTGSPRPTPRESLGEIGEKWEAETLYCLGARTDSSPTGSLGMGMHCDLRSSRCYFGYLVTGSGSLRDVLGVNDGF